MKEIRVTTQAELDAIPENFDGYIKIYGKELIKVSKSYIYDVQVCENSKVDANGNSSVVARDNSVVVARDNSIVYAYDNSSVSAYGYSFVYAFDSSSVEAWDNSSVYTFDKSTVTFHDSASGKKLYLEEQSGYISKEQLKAFATEVKMAFYDEFDELIPSIMSSKIDELLKQYGVEVEE